MGNRCSETWVTHSGIIAALERRAVMPWKDVSLMSLRIEFVTMATAEGANVRQLCRRYGVSPKTAYKWSARHRAGGPEALADRSRRPAGSPRRSPESIEAEILGLRDAHPAWGGRKL